MSAGPYRGLEYLLRRMQKVGSDEMTRLVIGHHLLLPRRKDAFMLKTEFYSFYGLGEIHEFNFLSPISSSYESGLFHHVLYIRRRFVDAFTRQAADVYRLVVLYLAQIILEYLLSIL